MLETREARHAFFAVFGGVDGWRHAYTALNPAPRPAARPAALAAARVKRRMANLAALQARWAGDTRDLEPVALPLAIEADDAIGRVPDRLRADFMVAWLEAVRLRGDLRLVRAVLARMRGSVTGYHPETLEPRFTGRGVRAGFEAYASILGELDARLYRGRGRTVATGHTTHGAVVYTTTREVRPADPAPHADESRPPPLPFMGTFGLAQKANAARVADAAGLKSRLWRAARKETTQGPTAPKGSSPSPEVTPSTGDGADATLLG